METWDQFLQELADALPHLHDPDYRPPELLYTVTGCDPRDGPAPVLSTIIGVIESLAPAADVPPRDRARRIYACLHARFVQHLTQDETAELLDMSPRHLRRAQREATYVLARQLWEHSLARDAGVSRAGDAASASSASTTVAASQAPDWRAQLRADLASLQQATPGTIAQVEPTIGDVVNLEKVLVARHGLRLRAGQVHPGLTADVHPSALRQVLVMSISRLAGEMAAGEIVLDAEPAGEHVRITVSAAPWPSRDLPDGAAIAEVMAMLGGSAEGGQQGERAYYALRLPAAGRVTVLVVDDNQDLVHFYRRCVAGTRYHIVHTGQGQNVLDMISELAPDVLVLDVMLPDIDGWKLLAQLHEHPDARHIPIIVCSVIREEALALALGAALYLPKPVMPREFTQALDRALHLASSGAS